MNTIQTIAELTKARREAFEFLQFTWPANIPDHRTVQTVAYSVRRYGVANTAEWLGQCKARGIDYGRLAAYLWGILRNVNAGKSPLPFPAAQ